MQKIIAVIFTAFLLGGCSMTSRDWDSITSAMDNGEFATGACDFYDWNDDIGRDDDISANIAGVCNSIYLNIYNMGADEHKCKVSYAGSYKTVYLDGYKSKEVQFSQVSGRVSYGFDCSIYNSASYEQSSSGLFRVKIIDGLSHMSVKNKHSNTRKCMVYDDGVDVIYSEVINGGEWSQWFENDDGQAESFKCIGY